MRREKLHLLVALLATTAAAQTAPVEVDDPLLAPIAQPKHTVPTFEAALDLLRAHNSDLRIQASRVRLAEGDRRVALARLLPSLSGSALAQQNILEPGQNFFVGGGASGGLGGAGASPDDEGQRPTHVLGVGTLTATVPLVDLPAWNGFAAARASRHAAVYTQEDLHRTLVRDLSRRLINAVTFERLAELERVGLRNALERVEIGRRSYRLGASNRLDLVRLEQDLQVTRGAVLRANEALRQAREQLGLLLGRSTEVGVAPGFNLAGLPEQARAVCQPVDSIRGRADLRAQQALIAAANERSDEALAQYLPTLGLRSELFAFTVDPGPISVPAWNIAAVLQFSFWDGGVREGNRTRVLALQRQAEEEAAVAERAARVEVTQARRSIEVARDRRLEAERARDLALESDALTRRGFELGRGSSLDLVQAASILRQAELNLALREFDVASAVVDAFASLASCQL